MADLEEVAEALPRREGREPRLAGKADVSELPDGRKVEDLSHAELNKALVKLKVRGASEKNTHEAAIALWERFLQRKYDEAGEDAVNTWIFMGEHHDRNDREDDTGE